MSMAATWHECTVRSARRKPITMRGLVEWTYATQKAHRGGDMMLGAAVISQTGLVVERLKMGCSIDSSPGGAMHWGRTHCDDDALAVHGMVEAMRLADRQALVLYGTARSVPDWRPEIMPLRCVPVTGRKGAHKGIYAHSGKTLIGHEITYDGDWPTHDIAVAVRKAWPDAPRLRCAQDVVHYARQQYMIWYDALCMLRNALVNTLLDQWRVASIGVERTPWECELIGN